MKERVEQCGGSKDDIKSNKTKATCAAPCKWYNMKDSASHCVSKQRFDNSYVAASDNCLNIRDQAGCKNLDTVCEWKQIDEVKPVTPPTNPETPSTDGVCMPLPVADTYALK